MITPRPLHRLGHLADAMDYLSTAPALSYVIFVNHPNYDVPMFADDAARAKMALTSIFMMCDQRAEVFISPCARVLPNGLPEWAPL